MQVSTRDYEESVNYLESIASKSFLSKLRRKVEKIELENRELDKMKGLDSKEREFKKSELSSQLNEMLNPYKKDYFKSHINRVMAYNQEIDIEDVSNLFVEDIFLNILVANKRNMSKDYKTIIAATQNINDVCVSSSVLAILYNCSRQSIHNMLDEKRITNNAIGHLTAFKLLDVLK